MGTKRVSAFVAAGALAIVLALVSAHLYLSPKVQANEWSNGHLIHGKIFQEFDENRRLGFNYGVAITGELPTVRNGAYQKFSRNANIYWNENVAGGHAQTVGGDILAKWGTLDYERGTLGFPTTREVRLSGGSFNHFERGSIYWTATHKARIVWGDIRDAWFASGAERAIGFPTTDELPTGRYGGYRQVFERGTIYWSPTTGARIVHGEIGNIWGRANWEQGNYGYPITNEFDIPGGRRQVFQGGPVDFYWDGRSVTLIPIGKFRWQDFIPDEAINTPCDPNHLTDDRVVSERYNGNNRSWNPEGSSKVRMDVTAYVNQANRGAKQTSFNRWIEETVQTLEFRDPISGNGWQERNRRTASADGLRMIPHGRESSDYPDVVRFRIESLAAQPFCDAPGNDGIKADFNFGFSPTTGAFWIDGTRRRMPNAEAYVSDLVTPGRGGWTNVGRWELQHWRCLLPASGLCTLQPLQNATANWNGGRVLP